MKVLSIMGLVVAIEHSHRPSHNIRKRKKKKKPKNRKQKTHHHKGNKETRQPQITKEISFLKLKFSGDLPCGSLWAARRATLS